MFQFSSFDKLCRLKKRPDFWHEHLNYRANYDQFQRLIFPQPPVRFVNPQRSIWSYSEEWKFSILFTQISIFDPNFDFWPKFRFLTQIWMLDPNLDSWTKFGFLNQISIFEPNFDFWPKFGFLNQIWIFDPNLFFWPKFRFLTHIYIFDLNFDFSPKFRFLTKILTQINRLIGC